MTDKGQASDAQIVEAERKYSESEPLRLLYGGSIVVQLGSQLYPSVTAAVAELISNAWDADAHNVWVTVPFDDDWNGPDSTIEVVDDGLGMDRREAQLKYLVVGRERRLKEGTDRTPGGRLLHGRKGIGKLAAFGTGHQLEVVTQRTGAKPVGFTLNYDELRDLEPAESALVEELAPDPLVDPKGKLLAHGTRVRLTKLQAKRRPAKDRFLLSMRRRFSLDASRMRVTINATPLKRFDMEFQYRFPKDAAPPGVTVDGDGLAAELIDSGDGERKEVRWWIGFTETPVKDDLLQGVSVLVRDKQAQRPFKFERTGGMAGQLGYEYLVGEVHADWIDDGIAEDDDLIASNRDMLQLEDPRLQSFIAWGRERLRWAVGERQRMQEERRSKRVATEMPQLTPVFRDVSRRERHALERVAERLGRVDGLDDSGIADVMQRVLDVREHHTAAGIAQEIRTLGDAAAERTWQLVEDAAGLERRTAASILDARLALLDLLSELLGESDAPPDLRQALVANPWVVDLRFDRAAVQGLEGDENTGEALALVGPPVWKPEGASIVLAACWDETRRPTSDEEWLAAVKAHADAHDAKALLVAREPVHVDAAFATTWAECLARSRRQHEAWLVLVRNGEES
jgi:Histidine kinase-, DNA gyrase B-, and HSP90-like ATPase